MILFIIMLKAQKTILAKQHEGCQRERQRERVLEHNGRNAKSHLIKHAFEKCHKYPKIEDFNVISK